jgi:hypothetical protein
VVAAVLVGRQVQGWAAVRALDDEVALRADVGVSATSTSTDGGRLDYYVTVRNTGPRPVRIDGLTLTTTRLSIRSRNFDGVRIGPGQAVDVPVSVRLDCLARSGAAGANPLRGTISAEPASGHPRAVATQPTGQSLVTDVADTVCRQHPGTSGAELSGPVL